MQNDRKQWQVQHAVGRPPTPDWYGSEPIGGELLAPMLRILLVACNSPDIWQPVAPVLRLPRLGGRPQRARAACACSARRPAAYQTPASAAHHRVQLSACMLACLGSRSQCTLPKQLQPRYWEMGTLASSC